MYILQSLQLFYNFNDLHLFHDDFNWSYLLPLLLPPIIHIPNVLVVKSTPTPIMIFFTHASVALLYAEVEGYKCGLDGDWGSSWLFDVALLDFFAVPCYQCTITSLTLSFQYSTLFYLWIQPINTSKKHDAKHHFHLLLLVDSLFFSFDFNSFPKSIGSLKYHRNIIPMIEQK